MISYVLKARSVRMPSWRRVGCCRRDVPEGVASAQAYGVKEPGISIAGAKDAMEGLFDAGGDCGEVVGFWIGLVLHGGDRSWVVLRVYAA
jgi:hypothetical protein